MSDNVLIFSKMESHPVGGVLGVIVSYVDKLGFINVELFYCQENAQNKIINEIHRWDPNKSNILIEDAEKEIEDKLKEHHEQILKPYLYAISGGKHYDGFNPYEIDRFEWKQYGMKDINVFIDYFDDFLLFVARNTKCKKLSDKILNTRELRSSFKII